jgi:hypothetical protein
MIDLLSVNIMWLNIYVQMSDFVILFLHVFSLVIMTLVDLAHGKPRHVPYRDSRLTFLLQVRYTKF